MATTTDITVNTQWAEIAGLSGDFLIQKVSGEDVWLRFGDTPPNKTGGYCLGWKDSFIRAGITGKLYARVAANDGTATLMVTVN